MAFFIVLFAILLFCCLALFLVVALTGFVPSRLLPKTKLSHDILRKLFFEDPVVDCTCTVQTRAGCVRGFQEPESHSFVFRGIPYAKAARLQKPQPMDPWSGEKSCLRFGPACPQPAFGFCRLANEGLVAFALEEFFPPLPACRSFSYGHLSEDECLNLNVFTPGLDGRRAVVVFIHGGAFQSGSNVEAGLYDGSRLAHYEDLVVITINYRIGPFGFLNFPEHGITNLGIRDQIAALEWVRDNVASFGGDPANVTIFGESAGAMSVGILLQCPKARGLFHAAIPFSGSVMLAQTKTRNAKVMHIVENVLQEKFKISGKLTPESFCNISAEVLVKLMSKTQFDMTIKKKLGSFDMMWMPYRGDDVLPLQSVKDLLQGCPPVMTGHMGDEWLFFRELFNTLAPDLAGPTKKKQALEFIICCFRSHFGHTVLDESPGDADKLCKYAEELYNNVQVARKLKGLTTDVQSICGGAMQFCWFEYMSNYLARVSGGYCFTIWGPPGTRNCNGHFREIPMLFNYGHPSGSVIHDAEMLGSLTNASDRKMSKLVMGAVSSFAKTRRPEADGIAWSPYPQNMNLQSSPAVSAFDGRDEDMYASFSAMRERIISDFGIGENVF